MEKQNTEWLVRERIVTSILEKSSGSLNCFSFHTGPGIKAKSANCNFAILLFCLYAFLYDERVISPSYNLGQNG